MRSIILLSAGLLLVTAVPAVADVADYKVKTIEKAPPKELIESVQKLLDSSAVQFTDKNGDLIAEVWLRKPIPVTGELKDNKAAYKNVPATSILAAVQFAKDWKDYRGKKIPAGVYSLRLGMQPQDGNHMGTSPYPEFCVLLAAKLEPKADVMDPDEMVERSAESIKQAHAGVLLLFPTDKGGATAELTVQNKDHIVLNLRSEVTANGKSGTLGIGLTLVGHANE
jgi:hypothetical protein